MIDYESELALVILAIEAHNLTGKVTEVTIEATPGPVDKYTNTKLSTIIKDILTNSPLKLNGFVPLHSCTRITLERRKDD